MRVAYFLISALFGIISSACSPLDSDASNSNQSLETMTSANANVIFVKAVQAVDGTWTFHVTVFHPDTGWDDYANGWDVVTEDGTVLNPDPNAPFTRLLLHPHVDEQPFTRSQGNIVIPDGVTKVIVRANDLVDGFGGKEVIVDLTMPTGENFEVQAHP